jgi:hypothetical protein
MIPGRRAVINGVSSAENAVFSSVVLSEMPIYECRGHHAGEGRAFLPAPFLPLRSAHFLRGTRLQPFCLALLARRAGALFANKVYLFVILCSELIIFTKNLKPGMPDVRNAFG